MFAFLDASALIYLVEAAEPFASCARCAVSDLAGQELAVAVALSRLTWLESRVRPLREGDAEGQEVLDAFFQRPDIVWIDLNAQVIDLATEIRARTSFDPNIFDMATGIEEHGNYAVDFIEATRWT